MISPQCLHTQEHTQENTQENTKDHRPDTNGHGVFPTTLPTTSQLDDRFNCNVKGQRAWMFSRTSLAIRICV